MFRNNQRVFILFIIISFVFFLFIQDSYASPLVTVVVNPDVTTVHVGSKPISLAAQASGKSLKYKWRLNGLGRLEGDIESSAVFYIPPDKIDGKSALVIIIVDVTDSNGEKTTIGIPFDIIPDPGLTPSPSPTPTSKPHQGMSTLTKTAIGIGAAAALVGGIALAVRDGDPTPTSTPTLEIIYPENNQIVYQRYIEVRGKGMRKNVMTFRCSVFTNQWFEQNNQYDGLSDDDGSWRTNVTLGGIGEYNDHTIKVEVTYSDGTIDSTQVTGVVVSE